MAGISAVFDVSLMVTLKIGLSQVKKEARELREDKRCPSKDKCIGILDLDYKINSISECEGVADRYCGG